MVHTKIKYTWHRPTANQVLEFTNLHWAQAPLVESYLQAWKVLDLRQPEPADSFLACAGPTPSEPGAWEAVVWVRRGMRISFIDGHPPETGVDVIAWAEKRVRELAAMGPAGVDEVIDAMETDFAELDLAAAKRHGVDLPQLIWQEGAADVEPWMIEQMMIEAEHADFHAVAQTPELHFTRFYAFAWDDRASIYALHEDNTPGVRVTSDDGDAILNANGAKAWVRHTINHLVMHMDHDHEDHDD